MPCHVERDEAGSHLLARGLAMTRFVLFLFLVGAAVYLLTPPRSTPEGAPEVVSTARISDEKADYEVSGPLRSSWGSSLQTLRQEPELAEAHDQQRYSVETTGSLPSQATDEKGSNSALSSQPSRLRYYRPSPSRSAGGTGRSQRGRACAAPLP